jgi:tyrosyl-tRNA synthetase
MTYRPRSDFLNVLETRGFVQDCTDLERLDQACMAGAITGYVGFDATATSLHVGSLIQIMMLRWLQRTGGRPICLMGGGTTRIGDPSFKDDARPLLDSDAIAANMAGIGAVFDRYLEFGADGALMLDNDAWLRELNYIEFLRDYGRYFSVNRMLSFDSVRLRLDRQQNLSFLEFNYMLLQAYDFLELHRRENCVLQMGGSDQWGNIVNGIDLTKRVADATVFGLTSPLLTTADGKKMGKTAAGAVWLDQTMLSSYDFWQFWRNTADADVGRFLKLYTELPLDEIARLASLEGSEINEAKKILADAVTTLAHGPEAAAQARATAQETFEKGGAGADLPLVRVAAADIALVALLVAAGLSASNREAKRLIADGGARVDDKIVADPAHVVAAQRLADGPVKLSAGRKRHVLVRGD